MLLKMFALVACLLCTMGAEAAEAYACFTSSNYTLTFYCDNLRSARTGTTYDLNTGNNEPGWVRDCVGFIYVVFDSSFANARPTSTSYWFSEGLGLVSSITGMKEYLNTSQVTTMQGMFCLCSFFMESLDLSGFNTDNVTNMYAMFYGCRNLRSLDLSGFYTSKVTDMSYMFEDCEELTTVYVGSGWSTALVTSSTDMFNHCYRLAGEKGTTYNASNPKDKTYAHIDGGPSNPGYLTKGAEAYAVYTTSPTPTLTFYYDNKRSSRSGTSFNLNTGESVPEWDAYNDYRKVVFDPSFANYRPASTFCWFRNAAMQSVVGINYLNTSQVMDMGGMFQNCRSLQSIDLSGFNTANVTNMGGMFYGCSSLMSLDLSNFNTSNVTNMAGMFYQCTALSSLDVSSFNTANVRNMSYMFLNCPELRHVDLSGFNTSQVRNMQGMFYYSSGLTTLDLSNFNTSNVSDMSYMFCGCSGLTGLELGSFNTANVTDMSVMFAGCTSLERLDLSSFNTANVTNMAGMFYDCGDLTTISVGNGWSTAAVTESGDMFTGCTSIRGEQGTTYDANHVDKAYAHIDGGTSDPGYLSHLLEAYAVYTSANTTLTLYYDDQRASRPGTAYVSTDPDDLYPAWYWGDFHQEVTRVVIDPSFANYRPKSTCAWFAEMWHLESITGMEYLNTSAVTNMSYMFSYCFALTNLDLSHFDTSKVNDMSYMFEWCYEFTDLDLSNFNTSNVTTMQCMFSECENISNLNVRSFNTAKVTDFLGMFSNCRNVRHLDISSFNTAHATDMHAMFWDCRNMTTIYAGNGWNTASVTDSEDMFYNCTKIVGGQGTTFDANHTDKAYAHIDGGVSNPGYFTDLMRGDANGDGKVNIADVADVIDCILSGNSLFINLTVADVNNDGEVNIADVVDIIDFLLKGTW